ncbi:unnamed protein product [Caenorhabditis brenneri]
MLFLLIPIFIADFESDLEEVIASFLDICTPECTFNYSEVTSKTIKYFPTDCWEVCGLITMNSNLDLSVSQLKDALKEMDRLYGGLRIENTNLETLSFFKEPEEGRVIYIICPDFGTVVANNKKLTNIDVFKTLAIYGKGQSLGPFQFVNNTKANAANLCNMGRFENHMDLIVDGNLKDCGERRWKLNTSNYRLNPCLGCHYSQLFPNSPKSSCIDFYGGLSFSNDSDPSSIYDLSKIKRLSGTVYIQWSNFQNLSFLSNLEIIKTIGPYDDHKLFMNLHDNPQMTKLAFPKLSTLENTQSGPLQINIENLHPEFCLTVQEIVFLMDSYSTFDNLHAKVCEYNGENIEGSKLCVFKNMISLENDCVHLYGDLVIGAGDEGNVGKLREVKNLIGSLTVQSTTLENLSFLDKMFYIAALNESLPAVQIIGNKNMKSTNLSQYLDIWTNRNRYCVIQGNHPDLVKSPESCSLFKPFLYINNMTYLGDQCGHVYYDANNKTIGIENAPQCTFNYSEVTSKTIKYFPKKCDFYCGLITLNSNLDLTTTQLKDLFKNMRWLSGGLRIENTNLKNLNFLVDIEDEYSQTFIQCPDCEFLILKWYMKKVLVGLQVINNTELTNLKVFEQLQIWGNGSIAQLRFVNNTKADASGLCSNGFYKDSMRMIVDGNLKDCGCYYHQLVPNSPKENCTDLYGPLPLDNISDPSSIYDLSKVQSFKGVLSIVGSRFQNLSFFSSLQSITASGSYEEFRSVFNLQNNSQMTRLAFPNLTSFENTELSPLVINLENLHPDFCLTVQELVFFMNRYRTFDNLHAKVCDYNGESIEQSKLCVFKDMTSLESDCVRIFGNLVVEAGDEKHVEKLKEVIGVIGSITIRSTDLENLSCLGKVRYIVNLHETQPAVALIGNKNLKSLADLSEYLDIWTNQNRFCVIQENHPDLVKPGESCNLFKPFLWMRNMTYLGDQCGQPYDEGNITSGLAADSGHRAVGTAWLLYFSPQCTFNYSEVTSKTIKFFPENCYSYCGLITLNANLDLTPKQLKDVFKDVRGRTIYGGLRIENTKLKDLNFLVDLKNKIVKTIIHSPVFRTHIINNTELKYMRVFEQLEVNGDNGIPQLRFVNNTKADASDLCDNRFYRDSMNMIVDGNLKDCGCFYHQLSPNSPKANCIDLYGPLLLDNISDPSSIHDLSKIESFKGDFSIVGSNFQNLSFFSSLQFIKSYGNYYEFKRTFNLQNNPQMTRLALPNLVVFENIQLLDPLVINFENLHPDFCLTVQEFVFLMERQHRTFDNLHAKVCEYNGEPIEDSKLCIFENMASLEGLCIYIFGNVVVGAGDEEYVKKLNNVAGVIGSVILRETSLEDLACIRNLRYIVALNGEWKPFKLGNTFPYRHSPSNSSD